MATRARRRRTFQPKRPRTQVGSRNGVRGGGNRRLPAGAGQAFQNAPTNFLPYSPEFEAGRRGLEDSYAGARMGLLNQQADIEPALKLQMERMSTDQGYQTTALKENLAERGIFATGGPYGMGGAGSYLNQRDILIPFGRARSDAVTGAFQANRDIASGLGQADLAYNQGLQDLYLDLAYQQAAEQPLSLPQYGGQFARQQNQRPRRRRNQNRRRR